jgi:hypothetical protein
MADAIRAGDDYHATLRSFGFVERTKGYDQNSLELCEECGWKAVIPGDGCLVCARQKAKPVAWFHAEKYKTHFTTDPSEDMIGKYWQPLYTAPQSINDFKPDWDTVKAYDEKFAEMLDEIQRLRAELKRTEQRLHDVATLCANVEGVLKAVNTAAMKLTADLTCMEVDDDDRLDRDRVMERVIRWRNEWDRAMFEYKPKAIAALRAAIEHADTAPRQWVELTDDEARALVNRATFGDKTNWQALVYMVDAKLKEKNG